MLLSPVMTVIEYLRVGVEKLKAENEYTLMLRRIAMTATEALAGVVMYLPVLFLFNRLVFKSTKKTVAYSAFAFYLASIYIITGMPTAYNCSFDGFVYLVPFVGMAYDMLNSLLNVVLFVPLGFFLPFLCDRFGKLKSTLLCGFLATFFVEALQLFTYRKTDINDIITNMLGTLIGFFIFRLISRKYHGAKIQGKGYELLIVSALILAVMFFVQPLIVGMAKEIIW